MRNHIQSVSGQLKSFVRWWIAELKATGGDLLTWVAPRLRKALTVFVSSDELIFSGDGLSEPIRLSRDSAFAPHLSVGLPAELSEALTEANRILLVFDEAMAFQRRLVLPLAAAPHLSSAVAIQWPKLLPIDPAKLLIDHEAAEITKASSHIEVSLAALKRAEVGSIAERLRSWGFRITGIHLSRVSDATHRFRFQLGAHVSLPRQSRRVDRLLLRSAAALVLACASVAVTEAYRSERALERALLETHSPAATALSRRQQLIAKLDPLVEMSQLEDSPSAIAVLSEVTQQLPRHSWLTTFELKDRHLRIVGLSPDASGAIKLLSSSTLLDDVELRSSMSAGVGTGQDRFEITADVKAAVP